MAIITLRTFVDGLEAMTITGVVRSYLQGPPTSATAVPDLPALFIAYPKGTGSKLVFKGQGGAGSLTAQLWILVEPVAQSLQGTNYDLSVDLANNLEAALFDLSCAVGGNLGWTIQVTNRAVAGTMYWAVIADVEGGRW